MSYTMNVFSIPSKISQIVRFFGQSFFNTNPPVVDSDSLTSIKFPDVPSWNMDGWVNVTIRQCMGGSFADGEIFLSSIRPKTTVRSTQTYRVAINFRDRARADAERLLVGQSHDLEGVLMHVRGEVNWINHKRGPNPILNVDWFQICEGDYQ